MNKKEFIGTCVENPFRNLVQLQLVLDRKRRISQRTFLNDCIVSHPAKAMMKCYPHDFAFYRSKNIYFFVHSAIEHFFK